jgi:hypothetical protein
MTGDAATALGSTELRDLVRGAVDLYVHPHPELLPRTIGVVELARQMQADGFAAAMLWNQFSQTAELATVVTEVTGFRLVGSIILNGTVGGVDARVVEHAIRMGARYVGMPSLSGSAGYRTPAMTSYSNDAKAVAGPVAVTDASGALLPEVHDVIELVATYDVALGLGYLTPADTFAVLDAARRRRVRRIAVLRPFAGFGLPADQLDAAMAVPGVVIQMPASSLRTGRPGGPAAGLPMHEHAVVGLSEVAAAFARAVRTYGAERCVLTSDTGWNDMSARQWLELGADALLRSGVRGAQLETMVRDAPAHLIGIG